jgi:Flp pilus assembly protein TadD
MNLIVRKVLINVALLLVLTCPAVLAQANSDANLSRLLEAVKAIEQDQLPQAESLLQSALANSPGDADAMNLLGVVRAKQGRPAEAERLFRRAIAISPRHLSAHINLAELLLTTNRPTLAIPVLLSAHKLAPERPNINLNLATVFAAKGDYQQSHEYASRVPREAFNADYFLVMLKSLIGLKRLEDARQLSRDFGQFSTPRADVQAEFAMLLAKGGLNDEALSFLEIAGAQTPTSFPLLYARGVINATLKRYGAAEEQLTSALRTKPDDVATLRALARIARATGNFEKSLSHLVQARRVAPNSLPVLYDFGVTALQMDLLLDALPVFEQLHRNYPREPAYLYGLAAVRWKKGEVVEAVRLMRHYVELQPRDASGFHLLGAALLHQELFAQARAALQRSLSLKADPDTEYLIGVSLEKAGNRVAAINTFRRVVHSHPNHAAAHAALGAAYREAGNYAEARLELERAVELDSNDLRANYQLGLVYAKLGETEAAKKMFARADDLRSRNRNQERVILKLIEAPQP